MAELIDSIVLPHGMVALAFQLVQHHRYRLINLYLPIVRFGGDPGEMSKLANMFAVLNLDAEDDREEVEKPTSSKAEADTASKKPGKSASPLS